MTTKRRPILAHPDDLYCVAFHLLVLASYGLAFWIYLHPRQAHITGPWSLAAFVIAAALLIGWIAGMDAGINFHNHAHKPIFNYGFLNRWFGRLWTFSSGWPSYFWRHAHVVVHHPNVLNPEKDWTVPVRDANGRPEHLFKYMVVHWPWRYYKHLWSEFMHGPKARRNTAIKEFLIFLVLWSIPFWIDWKMALLLWVIPQWVGNCLAMGGGMWVQHEGCEEMSEAKPHGHSNDHLLWIFQATAFNIGYHIEHHENPLVHWSELPQLHLQMRDELVAAGAHLDPQHGYAGATALACIRAIAAPFRKVTLPSHSETIPAESPTARGGSGASA